MNTKSETYPRPSFPLPSSSLSCSSPVPDNFHERVISWRTDQWNTYKPQPPSRKPFDTFSLANVEHSPLVHLAQQTFGVDIKRSLPLYKNNVLETLQNKDKNNNSNKGLYQRRRSQSDITNLRSVAQSMHNPNSNSTGNHLENNDSAYILHANESLDPHFGVASGIPIQHSVPYSAVPRIAHTDAVHLQHHEEPQFQYNGMPSQGPVQMSSPSSSLTSPSSGAMSATSSSMFASSPLQGTLSNFESSPLQGPLSNFSWATPVMPSISDQMASVAIPSGMPYHSTSVSSAAHSDNIGRDAMQDLSQQPSARPDSGTSSSASTFPVRTRGAGGRRGGRNSDGATKSKSHARKREEGHVKRPPNAFIMFRSHAYASDLIPKSLDVRDHRDVSRIVAHMWNNLPDDERKEWVEVARKEKMLHQQNNPGYKFKPDASRREKVKRNLKQEENAVEKCEVIADTILKSYGRQGVQIKPELRKKPLRARRPKTTDGNVMPRQADDKENEENLSASEEQPSGSESVSKANSKEGTQAARKRYLPSKSTLGKQITRPIAKRTQSAKATLQRSRGKGKAKAVDEDKQDDKEQAEVAALHPDSFVQDDPATARTSDSSLRRRSTMQPEPFEAIMSILAAADSSSAESSAVTAAPGPRNEAPTPMVESQSEPDIGLFMEWSQKLSEDAGFSAASNVFANPFQEPLPTPGLARAFSDTNILRHESQAMPDVVVRKTMQGDSAAVIMPNESQTRFRKRPERLALASSSLDGLPMVSPRSNLSNLPVISPSTSRFWHSGEGSAFQSGGGQGEVPSTSSLSAGQQVNERPKTTSHVMRHGEIHFNEDAMLVSPMYASFADMRRFSAAMSGWQALGHARRKSRGGGQINTSATGPASGALASDDFSIVAFGGGGGSRLSLGCGSSSSTGFGPMNSAGLPMTPGTARFEMQQHAINQSRRNSLALDAISGVGPLNLSPRAMSMDLDGHVALSSGNVLAQPPSTPFTALLQHHQQQQQQSHSHRRQSSLTLREGADAGNKTVSQEDVQRGADRLEAFHLSVERQEQEQQQHATGQRRPSFMQHRSAIPLMDARVAYSASANTAEENARRKSIGARYASDPQIDPIFALAEGGGTHGAK